MATNDGACKDRGMATAIIGTIAGAMKPGTQRAALESVAEWLCGNRMLDDVSKLTPQQRQDRIQELLTSERDCMTTKQRKERAAFYLEGLGTAPENGEETARSGKN